MLLESPFERIGLGGRAWEAVKQRPAIRIGFAETIHNHFDYQIVRHQLAFLHVLPGGLPKRRAARHVSTEQIAARHVRNTESTSQVPRLGALAGTRRTEQQQDLVRAEDKLLLLMGQGDRALNRELIAGVARRTGLERVACHHAAGV